MKEYTTDKIRNICLAGQRGCGKTSLSDAVAFDTGVNNRVGRVDDGSSILDYNESEIARKTTISSKILACEYKDTKINLLDCPGHADFIGEFLSALKVVEGVGILIDATSGVEIGTQLQWNLIKSLPIAKFFFVNKMEKENVKWKNNLHSIQNAFGKNAVAVQIPIGEALEFKGIVDLLNMKAYVFDAAGSRSDTEIPANLKDEVTAARENLIEVAAETDDALLEKFFNDGTLDDANFQKGLRKGIAEGKIYPVLFGSAAKNMGIKILLDMVITYLPSPDKRKPVEAVKSETTNKIELPLDPVGQPVVYVFKTVSEGHLGDMSYFKVFSGTIKPGMELSNQQTRSNERVAQIYSFQGKNRIELPSVAAGDIGTMVKLRDTHTGNTLALKGFDVTVPPVVYPNPVMDVAVKSKTKGDEEKVASGLNKLREEDLTFKLVSDPALKQQVLYGQGSTHIEVLMEKLQKRFGVQVDLVKPKIPYRETVRKKTEQQYKHKKQSGGRGQYGDVYIRIEPNVRGTGFEFIDEITGGVIPNKFIPAVEKGIIEQMQHGGLAGAPVVDVKVALYFGSYHDVDSSDMAFKIAGLMAFKEGFMKCEPVLLEPIYNIEVLVPDEYTGDVMGDLSSRRGKITGMDPEGRNQRIRATVPQAELYQYSVDLRSKTQGQGVFTMEFSHDEEVPHEVAQKVIAEARAEREAEG
ncbi:MAG: elongation factor G [candidate division Zixibacteria bacterium]|nr:elongation factor G [candidate division Zixibacteria bacterium]